MNYILYPVHISDRIEIYAQGSKKGGTGWWRVYDVAQRYMIGLNTTGDSWTTWTYDEPIDPNTCFEYAVAVEERKIIYEVAGPRYDDYNGFSGGDNVITDMMPGLVVGFNIQAFTP